MLPSKRRSFAHKIRPQSVVENLSLSHIPDLLESPGSRRSSNASAGGASVTIKDCDENCDSITELPSASLQLQHLVKGRPKRAKTRAPTRPLVTELSSQAIGEGLEAFFRPGSVTPTTLTPLVSPTSDECSSLSFVDSPTMSRCDENGKNYFTSEETTPVLEERRAIKLERNSPLMKGTASAVWCPARSRSTDNLERFSPVVGRKSPLVKMNTEGGVATTAAELGATDRLNLPSVTDAKTRSPSNESIKSFDLDPMPIGGGGGGGLTKNGLTRTPIMSVKPRPWSVAGNEGKCDFTGDKNQMTPDAIDTGRC